MVLESLSAKRKHSPFPGELGSTLYLSKDKYRISTSWSTTSLTAGFVEAYFRHFFETVYEMNPRQKQTAQKERIIGYNRSDFLIKGKVISKKNKSKETK